MKFQSTWLAGLQGLHTDLTISIYSPVVDWFCNHDKGYLAGLADVRYFTLLYICSLASKYSKHSVNDVNECPLSDTEQLSGCDEEGETLLCLGNVFATFV